MARVAPARYDFRTIADLHAIPLERIDAFLVDLGMWLAIVKCEQPGFKVADRETFHWIDDDKHDANVMFQFVEPE